MLGFSSIGPAMSQLNPGNGKRHSFDHSYTTSSLGLGGFGKNLVAPQTQDDTSQSWSFPGQSQDRKALDRRGSLRTSMLDDLQSLDLPSTQPCLVLSLSCPVFSMERALTLRLATNSEAAGHFEKGTSLEDTVKLMIRELVDRGVLIENHGDDLSRGQLKLLEGGLRRRIADWDAKWLLYEEMRFENQGYEEKINKMRKTFYRETELMKQRLDEYERGHAKQSNIATYLPLNPAAYVQTDLDSELLDNARFKERALDLTRKCEEQEKEMALQEQQIKKLRRAQAQTAELLKQSTDECLNLRKQMNTNRKAMGKQFEILFNDSMEKTKALSQVQEDVLTALGTIGDSKNEYMSPDEVEETLGQQIKELYQDAQIWESLQDCAVDPQEINAKSPKGLGSRVSKVSTALKFGRGSVHSTADFSRAASKDRLKSRSDSKDIRKMESQKSPSGRGRGGLHRDSSLPSLTPSRAGSKETTFNEVNALGSSGRIAKDENFSDSEVVDDEGDAVTRRRSSWGVEPKNMSFVEKFVANMGNEENVPPVINQATPEVVINAARKLALEFARKKDSVPSNPTSPSSAKDHRRLAGVRVAGEKVPGGRQAPHLKTLADEGDGPQSPSGHPSAVVDMKEEPSVSKDFETEGGLEELSFVPVPTSDQTTQAGPGLGWTWADGWNHPSEECQTEVVMCDQAVQTKKKRGEEKRATVDHSLSGGDPTSPTTPAGPWGQKSQNQDAFKSNHSRMSDGEKELPQQEVQEAFKEGDEGQGEEQPEAEDEHSSVESLPEGTACQTPENWAVMRLPLGEFHDFQWQYVACPNVDLNPKDEVERAVMIARNMHLSDCHTELNNVNIAPGTISNVPFTGFANFKRDKFYQSPYSWPKSCGPKWRQEASAESKPEPNDTVLLPSRSPSPQRTRGEDQADDSSMLAPKISAEPVPLHLPTSYRGPLVGGARDPPPSPKSGGDAFSMSVADPQMSIGSTSFVGHLSLGKHAGTSDLQDTIKLNADAAVPKTPKASPTAAKEVNLCVDLLPNVGSRRRTKSPTTGSARRQITRSKVVSSHVHAPSSEDESPLAAIKTPRSDPARPQTAPKKGSLRQYNWGSQRVVQQPLPQGSLNQCLSGQRHGTRLGSTAPL